MKTTLILCLVVFLGFNEAAVVKVPGSRANLNVGNISYTDRLLHRSVLYQPAIPNAIQYQDVVYRGNTTTRVAAVQATEQGYTQWGTAYIVSGGVGHNNVTVRVQSARGYGYYYLVDIWGR